METADEVAKCFEQPNLVNITLEDGGTFWVQEVLLCNLSSYFSAALKGSFKERRTKTLVLPGCTTTTFKHLLFWIINRKIAVLPVSPDDTSDAQVQLVHLWAAGQMYLLSKLQIDIMDCLLHMFKMSPPRAAGISMAFELTSEDSIWRELFLFELAARSKGLSEYSEEEMDKIGSIPGFTKAYVELSANGPEFRRQFLTQRAHRYRVPEERVSTPTTPTWDFRNI